MRNTAIGHDRGVRLGILLVAVCGALSCSGPSGHPPVGSRPSAPVVERVWTLPGADERVLVTDRFVFATIPSGHVVAYDRTTRTSHQGRLDGTRSLLRANPLIVERWDGQGPGPGAGTHIVGLSDLLEPMWGSERMRFSFDDCSSGALLIVERQSSPFEDYLAFDPETGAERFRLTLDTREQAQRPLQGDGFVVVKLIEGVLFVDSVTGEVQRRVPGVGGTPIVGRNRAALSFEDRLAGFDSAGLEVWSRPGELDPVQATHLRCRRDTQPELPTTIVAIELDRGVLGIDLERGTERWLIPVEGELEVDDVAVRGDSILLSLGRGARLHELESGRQLFACEACAVAEVDGGDVLVEVEAPAGHVSYEMHTRAGLRWSSDLRFPAHAGREGERPDGPSVALTPSVVAVCPRGGPITFLDRASGRRHSVEPTASLPREQRGEREPFCAVLGRGPTLIVKTELGLTVFETRAP